MKDYDLDDGEVPELTEEWFKTAIQCDGDIILELQTFDNIDPPIGSFTMKRYRMEHDVEPFTGQSMGVIGVEDADGEWIPADVAQTLYDTLVSTVDELEANNLDATHYRNVLSSIKNS